uniref:Uncharacterized protein n=1 Tax=Trichobilharzia regenti TaxID=157069 RepID=A0AA85J0X2_TRIRE|nr:unnamed protein product [Trichobilharzia regenti]
MRNLLIQALLSFLLLLSNNNASYSNKAIDDYLFCEDHGEVLMIELQTFVDPQNVEETIKPEILRLEHLYQSKWAKEFLEYKYRKAFEVDIALQSKSFGKLFAETSGNSKKDEVQTDVMKRDLMEVENAVNAIKADLQGLRTAAVNASNAYRKNLKTLNNTEIMEAYKTARYNFADSTDGLRDIIKLLEMKRIEFLKFQTQEFRINWILDQMKKDAEQY